MSFDPFGDFETTGYLRNSLGLKDPAEVKENEHFSFEMGLDEALSYLERTKNLNYQALLQVHRLLFEKFYPWAGRDRLELVPHLSVWKGPKGAPRRTFFESPAMIERAVDYALSLASKKQGFMQKPGEVMGLLCFAHPFLDGNGRSILLFYMELSYRAGFAIDWASTRKDDYLQALDDEIHNPGKGPLDRYLVPFVVPIHSRDQWPEIIGQINGLDGMDGENITYENLDDPEVQKVYAAYHAEHPYPAKDGTPDSEP